MKKINKYINLSIEEALVLQQISESGEEDLIGLARSLQMSRQRVATLLTHLKHKGLIRIKASYGDWWVQTSRKGTKLVRSLWPELQLSYR
jgi:DNA-binding MarR family transcriptional regulator